MNGTEIRETAEEIYDQAADEDGFDEPLSEVESRVSTYAGFGIPRDEVEAAVISDLETAYDIDLSGTSGDDPSAVTVEQIGAEEGEGDWVSLTVKFVQAFDDSADALRNIGIVGDETGTCKFVEFANTDGVDAHPENLTPGDVIEIDNAVIDLFDGDYQLKVTSATDVRYADADIDVGDDSEEFTGTIVAVNDPSGLIKRCPHEDCSRVLNDGRCSEHGSVDGEFDMRLKLVLDDGRETRNVVANKALTERMTGISIEEAQEMAMDALDTSVVGDKMEADLLGRSMAAEITDLGNVTVLDDFAFEESLTADDVDTALVRARSLEVAV